MKARVDIQPGVCGFRATACVTSEDGQYVVFESVTSGCEKIGQLAEALRQKGAIDAYQEINAATESVLMAAARTVLKGCCSGCAVPVGLFKGMQAAAQLALPQQIAIQVEVER